MKTARNIILTFLLASSLLAPACNTTDDDCNCGNVREFFDIQGVASSNFRTLENSGFNIQPLLEEDAVEWDRYSLASEFAVEYYGMAPTDKKEPSFWSGLSLINEAWACSCLPNGFSGSEETLDFLDLITLEDFDDNHPAGSSIKDILNIRTFSEFEGLIHSEMDLDVFLVQEREAIAYKSFDLLLQVPPATTSTQQFQLIIQLSNGESYSIDSPSIEITR